MQLCFCNLAFAILKTFSIGFKSGLLGEIENRSDLTSSMACFAWLEFLKGHRPVSNTSILSRIFYELFKVSP